MKARRVSHRLVAPDRKHFIGLLSGTSVDAIEAVACIIEGTGASLSCQLLAHVSVPFPRRLANRILNLEDAKEVCRLNFELGERFAQAALDVMRLARVHPKKFAAIGSHGQTVVHLPGSTLQIGEASVIAERTRVAVVCDFRTRDVAAGGEGAPLVPYADWALFRKAGVTRALQNIGGIGNVSVVSDRLEDTLAFDTGPGNMLLDALARKATRGRLAYDKNGQLARKGQVNGRLLAGLLRHPFLKRPPPRSAGREQFGQVLADELWGRFGKKPYDLLATATAFTIESTARAYERFILPQVPLEAVYLSGGGTRNPLIAEGLRARLSPLPVRPLEVLGVPEAAKEAVCFAILASEFMHGTAQSVVRATGARRPAVLGKWVPA